MTAIATALPPFYPEQTSTLACTTTSGTTRLTLGTVGDVLEIQNEGPSTAFLAFGDTTANPTATAGGTANASNDGSYPILVGQSKTVRVNAVGSGVNVAGITASGTATVRITRGSGV